MKGYIQGGDTIVFKYSGKLIGGGEDEHFQLKAGEVFGVDAAGLASHPHDPVATQVSYFILAEDFDSRFNKALVGYLPGKAVPAIPATGVTIAAGGKVGLHASQPRITNYVLDSQLLGFAYQGPANGRVQIITLIGIEADQS